MDETQIQAITEALTKRDEFERKLVFRAWEDEAFKEELVRDPEAVYAREMGQEVPDLLNIQVLEEGPATIYLVIPRNPAPTAAEGELSDEALEAVAGGGWAVGSRRQWVVGWS